MTPRTILYTGKGGVGKTSVAACTARRLADAGRRTLVISTDPAHSLSESLEFPLGSEPVAVNDLLWGQEVNAQDELTRHWAGVQDWLGGLLIERGIDRISAQELTVPPGMDELFSLLVLQQQHSSGAMGRDHRRLRADGRDAAAAVLPRCGALVDRQGVPAGATDPRDRRTDRPHAARHSAAGLSGLGGRPTACPRT